MDILSLQVCLFWKWDYTICGLLLLVYFILHNVFKVYPDCGTNQDIMSFHCQITIHLMGIYHILLIHSSSDGRLGSFLCLAIKNNAIVNICLQVFV